MIFNFYIFKLIIFIAFSNITERMFSDVLGGNVAETLVDMSQLPNWVQLIVFFVCIDFVSWATHYCLHRIKFLWRFHKVHHSVKQMACSTSQVSLDGKCSLYSGQVYRHDAYWKFWSTTSLCCLLSAKLLAISIMLT